MAILDRMNGLLALAAVGVLGCATADSAYYNLRETRRPDGRIKRVGALMSPFEWALRRSFTGLGVNVNFMGESPEMDDKPDQPIEDPLAEGLEALLDLLDVRSRDPRVAGMQVEACAWLAGVDDYDLSRERAVIGLGAAAERLGLHDGPSVLGADVVAATPAQLAVALGFVLRFTGDVELIRGGLELQAERLEADDTPPADLAAACRAVEALDLDLDGARRGLAICNRILDSPILSDVVESRVSLLSEELQRAAVARGLAAALNDPEPWVRAAAVSAVVRGTGNRRPDVLWSGLMDIDPWVRFRALGMIEELGLPTESVDEARPVPELDDWLNVLVPISSEPNSRVATAACRALGKVSETGMQTLRPERWQIWWRNRGVEAGDSGS